MSLQQVPLPSVEAVYMAAKPWLNPASAGAIIRKARERLSLTQDQVADTLDVDKSYISKLEGGLHHAGRSKYFPQLASVLKLTPEEIRGLNPGAVIDAPSPQPPPLRSRFQAPNRRPPRQPLWPNLAKMIEEKQERHPQLREDRWQQYLNNTRFASGREPDEEGWFEIFQSLRRHGVEPEEWPEE